MKLFLILLGFAAFVSAEVDCEGLSVSQCTWKTMNGDKSEGTRSNNRSGRFFTIQRRIKEERAAANGEPEAPKTTKKTNTSIPQDPDIPDDSFLIDFSNLSQSKQASVLNGMDALDRGDPKNAFQIGHQLQTEYPNNSIGYRLAAQALAGAGQTREALKEVQNGLKKSPEDEGLNALEKLLSRRLNRTFNPKLSLKDPKKKPLKDNSYRGKTGEGSTPLSAVTHTGAPPARSLAEIKEGMTLLSVGDHKKAITHFTGILNKDPNNALVFRLRALANFEIEQFKTALSDINAGLEHAPQDTRAHELRGRILSQLGQDSQAQAAFDRAIELDPRSATLYVSRSRFLKKIGDRAGELADLKRAASLDSAYESLYRKTLTRYEAEDPKPLPEKSRTRWAPFLGAGGLLLIGFLAFRKRNRETGTTPTPTGTDYEILRKLGEGGMGEVYAVKDRRLDRIDAVKRMKPEIASNPDERARFLREARTVAALKHPGIVEIHQVIDDGDDLYLVFELIDGGTLADRIKIGSLSLDETKNIISQIATALDYAHSKGVIHRDLKPANILLSGRTAKVTDFGVARRPGETVEIIGTPGFMAPEQLLGKVSPAIDIYALAVCAREMLGRPLPDSLDRATDPDPEKRFASAGDFARAFSDIQ